MNLPRICRTIFAFGVISLGWNLVDLSEADKHKDDSLALPLGEKHKECPMHILFCFGRKALAYDITYALD